MATRTSSSLKHAFKRFVELVQPVEDVRHVVAMDEGEPDIYTFITKRDEGVSSQVHQAEFQIMEQFPDLPIDFHVRYMEGRTLQSFIHPLPSLVYSKNL